MKAKDMGQTLALIFALLLASVGTALSIPLTSDEVRVIDGDTIRLLQQKPDVRLVGFNAPETRRALCDAERDLGGKATARLRDLVRSSKLDFEFVATEGTPSCNYGRRCGILKANGRDVSAILISENLAVPSCAHKQDVRRPPNHGAGSGWLMPPGSRLRSNPEARS